MAGQVVSYSPNVLSSIPAVSNCLLATQMLTEALTKDKIHAVLSEIAQKLGRCILGLAKRAQQSADLKCQNEFTRIVSLITAPGSAFYTEPLL